MIPTHFERLGGEPALRAIIDAFIDAVTSDAMVGFFFTGVDVNRLKQREYEFTAQFLGAKISYTGRPIDVAHARHRIMGGHFDRRRGILARVLESRGIDPEIRRDWLAHVDKLRAQVTSQGRGECD